MAINIKDETAEENIRKLAALQGKTITAAVADAVVEQLKRAQRMQALHGGRSSRLHQMREIAKSFADLPVYDNRSANEILGYDENGLPN